MKTAEAQFGERFPKYALLAPRWIPKVPTPCELKIHNLQLNTVEVLYVFGLRIEAYLLLKEWLHANPERQLVFLEEDEGIIAAAILDNALSLSDPQVDLEWLQQGPQRNAQLIALAERYPAKRIETVNCTSKPFKLESLTLLRKTTLSHAHFTDRLHSFQLFHNFVRNTQHLPHMFYANGLRGAFQGVPAIVCGAGPSLQNAISLLKELDGRALIIAGGSTLAALSAAGVEPHFGMAVDPNEEEMRRFEQSFCNECPLLISTRVYPGIFRTCNGPFGYMRSGIGGACELWLEDALGLNEPQIAQHLSEESMSVTSTCLAFAQYIGCTCILLSGVDLAYTDGKRYATGVMKEELKNKSQALSCSTADQILWRKDKRGMRVATAVRWVMEAASIAHLAKCHPEIRWINTTEGGLSIAGLEEMSLKRAAKECLSSWWDLRGKVTQQIALNPLPALPGAALVEFRASLERLIEHLEVLNEQRPGSKALAEFELHEEIAYSVLLYDMPELTNQALSRKLRGQNEALAKAKWALQLQIAKKHLEQLV